MKSKQRNLRPMKPQDNITNWKNCLCFCFLFCSPVSIKGTLSTVKLQEICCCCLLMDSHSWNLIVKAKTRCVLTLSNGFLWALFPLFVSPSQHQHSTHFLFPSYIPLPSFLPSRPLSLLSCRHCVVWYILFLFFFSLNLRCLGIVPGLRTIFKG